MAYLEVMAGIFSMDNSYLAGKTPSLVRDMLVNFGDILQETSKSSACCDMGGNSNLTWLSRPEVVVQGRKSEYMAMWFMQCG